MASVARTIAGIVRLHTFPRTRRPIRRAANGPSTPQRPAVVESVPDAPRRRRPRRRTVAAGLLGATAVVAIATTLVLTTPQLEPVGPLRLTREATPTIELRLVHPAGVPAERIAVTIGGERVDTSRVRISQQGERVRVRVPALADGEHDVRVHVRDVGILRRDLRARWSLQVDTTPPSLRTVSPAGAAAGTSAYVAAGVAVVTKAPMQLTVAAEPGTSLEVDSSAPAAEPVIAPAIEEARRTIDIELPQGAQQLAITATDEAGNTTARTLDVLVDTVGPAVQVKAPRVIRDATLALPVTARDPHGVELRVLLDGNELDGALREVSVTPAPQRRTAADAAPDGAEETAPPVAGSWKLVLDEGAYEGRHALEVIATDSLGTRRTLKRTLLVDSTEELSAASGLRPGARGRDVAQLQKVLLEQQIVPREQLAADIAARSYGAQTRTAVQAFQRSRGMQVDGVAGGDTVAGLTLKIVIDRGANTLTLYRVGEAVKTYRVATGSPKYPTPAGDFEIQTMQKHPTWTPPDSDWAKDAVPIPPGPDNPLGTRWMAIDGTVGIHGTNNPASLGYSVSHGCIRMAIPDVEELFEQVSIGTPVTVV